MTERLTHNQLCSALRVGLPATLSAVDIRHLLGITHGTLIRWMREGEFPPESGTSQRKARRWNSVDIAEWMKRKNIPFPKQV